ncbi:unnamed protein product [Fusarium graminearum]|uniref:Uncharacterized protein n=1 Tax=Gibberella zeae TaxID=5518 RepID=A0A9N8RPE9_GIBZA|nr:unnamed protein product [Fusarium graminearum]
MPSKTDVSDVPSANATHGSATPPSDKDTKTPSNGTASSHYPVAETEDEKKKRRDELLVGVGSHLNKSKSFIILHCCLFPVIINMPSNSAVSGVSSAKATDRSAESCRDKDTNISPDIFPASDSHAGDTEDKKKERQDELLIGVGSLLNIGTMVPSTVFPTPDSDSAEITDEKKKRQDELLIGIGSQYNKVTNMLMRNK